MRLRLSCCLQSGRDLQEPLLERSRDRLEAVDGDAGLNQPAVDVGAGLVALDVGAKGQPKAVGQVLGRADSRMAGDDGQGSLGPCATTRPRSTIATASQIFSTSSSRCDDSSTVRPSSTNPRIM